MLDETKLSMILERYTIDKSGTICRNQGQRKGRPLSYHFDRCGYPIYSLTTGNRRHGYPIHTLLAHCFIPKVEGKPFVNHRDGIKANFSLDNLEWCTQRENIHHAIRTGLTNQIGENQGAALLRDVDVHKMMQEMSQGETIKDFLKKHKGKASRYTLQHIYHGRQWVHITSQYGITPKVKRVHTELCDLALTSVTQ